MMIYIDFHMEIDPEILLKTLAQTHHECESCGKCCKESEEILVTPTDLQRIADHYHISVERARIRFTKRIGGRYLGIKRTLPCMFYSETTARCKIYVARPQICRDYPFRCQIGNDSLDYMGCPAAEDAVAHALADQRASTKKYK